jgi:hypothetical protein
MTTRRLFLVFSVVLVALLPVREAWAGSYLERASLLLDEARREGDLLEPRLADKDLVELVRALAAARLRAAHKMEVPAAVGKAHPHLLLVLERYERASTAAANGDYKKFVEHLHAAREEERTFRALIAELGYTLPEHRPRR